MNWDLLLEWMAHTGSGQWGAFRAAIESLAGPDCPDSHALARRLRIGLSDFGHADFFIGGTARWRARKPLMAGLSDPKAAIIVGARTRKLADDAAAAAQAAGAVVDLRCFDAAPTQIRIVGDEEMLKSVGDALGIPFAPQAGIRLALRCPATIQILQAAPEAEEPVNWGVQSFSISERRWLDGRLERTARQYENRHGARRFFLAANRTRLLEIEKRYSIYAAALLQNQPLAHYQADSQKLLVPARAPLPVESARALCLAGGEPAVASGDALAFQSIDAHVAGIVLAKLGHRIELGGWR